MDPWRESGQIIEEHFQVCKMRNQWHHLSSTDGKKKIIILLYDVRVFFLQQWVSRFFSSMEVLKISAWKNKTVPNIKAEKQLLQVAVAFSGQVCWCIRECVSNDMTKQRASIGVLKFSETVSIQLSGPLCIKTTFQWKQTRKMVGPSFRALLPSYPMQ